MIDEPSNNSPQSKPRKSKFLRKRKCSQRKDGEKTSETDRITIHKDEEKKKSMSESAPGTPKIKKRKEDPDAISETIKSEDTVSQNGEENVQQSLTFEVTKDEVFKTPTKEPTALDIVKEEDYDLQRLKCSPSHTPDSKRSMSKSVLEDTKLGTQTPRRTPLSEIKRQRTVKQCTPNNKRERKISLASDYDQLSDTIKSDLYNSVNFNEMEPIDMMHDMDTVLHFEDIEVNQVNSLLSNITQPAEKANNNDMDIEDCKDPVEDPLYISENEKRKDGKKKKKKLGFLTRKLQAIKYIKLGKPSKKSIIKRTKAKVHPKLETQRDLWKPLKRRMSDSKIDKNNYDSSNDVEEALLDLKIKLVHDVPPQHTIETSAGSKVLTLKQKRLFESYGPLRKGIYSSSEDETIKQNWESFCQIHKWDPQDVEPFLYMRHGTKYYIKSLENRQKFVQFLARGLPWRTLESVYRRFRKLYETYNKTFDRYTANEDDIILSYIGDDNDEDKVNKKFSELSKLLQRTRKSIWVRYRRLQKGKKSSKNPLTTVVWTKTLIANFINQLMDVTLSEDIAELKDATIPKPVWLKLEDKLKISQDVLKTFWVNQLHMQLFCPRAIYLNDIKIQLIEYIYAKGFSSTREIIWPNVAKYFEGVTTIFLCRTFFHLVREVTIRQKNLEFTAIIEHLYQEKIRQIQEDPTDKYLPRLKYVNGSIETVVEEMDDHTKIE